MRRHTTAPRVLGRLAVALLLSWTAIAAAQDLMLDPQVFEIGRELRCPTCVAESVAESNAGIAREMRQIIQEQLDQGSSRAEILAFFQDRYGDWILLTPPRSGVLLIVWLLPIAAALAGVAALVLIVRRWRKAADQTATATPEDLARVRAALAGGGQAPATTADDAGPAPAPRR